MIADIEAMNFGFIRVIGEDKMCFWAEPGALRPVSTGAYDPWAISDPLKCKSMSLAQWQAERARISLQRSA